MTAFVIPQVPGSIARSHPVDGVAESLVKSKKYILPLVILAPEVAGGVAVAYLVDGRLKLPKAHRSSTLATRKRPARRRQTPAKCFPSRLLPQLSPNLAVQS